MADDCGAGDEEDMMAVVESVVDDEGLRSKRLALTSKSQHFMSIRIGKETSAKRRRKRENDHIFISGSR